MVSSFMTTTYDSQDSVMICYLTVKTIFIQAEEIIYDRWPYFDILNSLWEMNTTVFINTCQE